MDGRSDTHEWPAAGAGLPIGHSRDVERHDEWGVARHEDRLDAAFALLLALSVLGSVWWYAA